MPVTALVHKHLLPGCRFNVITDKGTLDAVGLMADAEQNRWANIATCYFKAAASNGSAAKAGLHKDMHW